MKIFSLIFFSVVALVNVFCNKANPESDFEKDSKPRSTWLENLSKALIIPGLLLIYYIFSPSVMILMIIALLCGWIGDIILMIHIEKEKRSAIMSQKKKQEKVTNAATIKMIFTIIGAIFFASGHILYFILFFKDSYSLLSTHVLFSLLYLPYLIYGLIVFPVIFKGNDKKILLQVLAFIYLVIITIMSYAALIKLIYTPHIGSLILFAGTLFFILSDSVLAIKLIKLKNDILERLIMGSYITAQLLIVVGVILIF